jgi:Ca2+:H+ antiporter
VAAVAGVIPTAALMGTATEQLAARAGAGIGGLLNVTFGNAPELLIALFALRAGLHDVVKASLVGSILSNSLLVLGGAMAVGGRGRQVQRFNATAASAQASMLLLACAALVMPAVFELVSGAGLPRPGENATRSGSDVDGMSVCVALVLLAGYLAGLLFSLRTHRDLFNPVDEDEADAAWPLARSVGLLAVAGLAVALLSELLVDSITHASESAGLSPFFVSIIVVAIAGNAAEHWVALSFAARDKLDVSVNIAIGSSAQIALFVAPVLVLVSTFVGPSPMPLVFNGLELAALVLAVGIVSQVTQRGESTWFEGLGLVGVYLVLAVVFFYVGAG